LRKLFQRNQYRPSRRGPQRGTVNYAF
jgi:hypothetical protein